MQQQVVAAFEVVVAASELVRERREISEGDLYALLMDKLTLEGFEKLANILRGSGLIERRGHLLRWTGPEIN